MKKFIPILSIALCAGCAGLVPSERKESRSVAAAESLGVSQNQTITRTLEVGPEMVKSIAADPAVSGRELPPIRERVEITTTQNGTAGTTEKSAGSSINSLPLGSKLILLSIGLLLIMVAIWVARKGSVAVDATWRAADNGFGALIGKLEQHAQTSTNPDITGAMNSLLAAANKERGKLAAQVP